MKDRSIFLDIDQDTAADPGAPLVVLPLPYERTVCYGTGTRQGPAAILRASREIEDFDEELKIPVDLRVRTLDPPDLSAPDAADALEAIRVKAATVMRDDRFLLSLGGEHTVTLPLVTAAQARFKDLWVLHLDAHLDLRDSYLGRRDSHACVMRRIRELGIPTAHVGIRGISAKQHAYTQSESVPVLRADEWLQGPGSRLDEFLAGLPEGPAYLSLDIDVMDPSLAPGTGTPEPGGALWADMLALLGKVFRERQFVAADIVEVSPVPGTRVTEYIAARLGAKILLYHSLSTHLPEPADQRVRRTVV